MLGYIVTALYVYLIARALTRRGLISYLCTLIFLLNPTLLYLQSIPSGELIIGIAMSMMVCYYLVAWIHSGKPGHLLGAAGALCLATLCSYDAWLFLAVIFALILLVGLIKRQPRAQIASNLLVFTILGGLGIGLWLPVELDYVRQPNLLHSHGHSIENNLVGCARALSPPCVLYCWLE